jgi:AraC-like DNA-binding protein
MQTAGDVLSAMRLAGGVILDAEFRGRWSVISSFPPDYCAQFFPIRGSLISYHFVREGELSAAAGDLEEGHVGPGSILLFPRNHDHRLFNADLPPLNAGDYVVPPDVDGPATLRLGEGETTAKIYCGFLSATSHQNPLLERLPPMLVLRPDASHAAWVGASMRLAAEAATQDPALVGKLAELMFAEAVQLYLETNEDARRLADALADPSLARALDYIHAHHAEDIEVDAIAREAGLSRTVLGERFVETMGEPPIRYCARYRMRKAADLLERGAATDEAAYAVGFSSAASFTRAFKREYGEPPATWARNMRAPPLPAREGQGDGSRASGLNAHE